MVAGRLEPRIPPCPSPDCSSHSGPPCTGAASSSCGVGSRWLRAGGVLAALGALLGLACAALFVARGRGTPARFDAPRTFVAVGPYRWVRNPMYVGGMAMLAGAALWLRSPGMLLFSAIAWLVAHLFVLFYEERTLRRRFGESYEEYTRRVNRWWPRWPRRGRVGSAGR